MIQQDIATRRARDLERYHRRVAERRAKGLCLSDSATSGQNSPTATRPALNETLRIVSSTRKPATARICASLKRPAPSFSKYRFSSRVSVTIGIVLEVTSGKLHPGMIPSSRPG